MQRGVAAGSGGGEGGGADICQYCLGKPSIKKNIFLLTFVNKRGEGGVWSELRQ